MKTSRNLVLSLEILAAHKLRTLLSMAGIVVGVASVGLVVSAGKGAEKRILDRIRDMGTNLVVVHAGQTRIIAGRRRQLATVTTLVPGDAKAIESRCPSVALAAPAVVKKMSTRWESETANTNVIGITAGGVRIRNMAVEVGRLFTPEENRARRRAAVLGRTAAKNLFGTTDPIGLRFRIHRVPFEVIGVLAAKGMDVNGQDQDDLILVPLETAMRRLLNIDHVETLYVQACSAELLGDAEREIRDLLIERHRLHGRAEDFTIQNQATLLETERETARSLTLLIGGVAAISLVVGGVGILAVMLISVKERTREIGLRRAVGARRRDIRNQFLVESGLLAGSGGLAGITTGLAAGACASGSGHWDMAVSWPAMAAGLSFSVLLGVVFGIYPALRAARLEPIEALRAEA